MTELSQLMAASECAAVDQFMRRCARERASCYSSEDSLDLARSNVRTFALLQLIHPMTCNEALMKLREQYPLLKFRSGSMSSAESVHSGSPVSVSPRGPSAADLSR